MNEKKLFLWIMVTVSLFVPSFWVLADGPVITGISNLTREATSSAGAFASFSPTATDPVDATDTVSCVPPSGTTFPLGTTTVSCSASDSTFATTTASFTVSVIDTTAPTITPPTNQTFATSTFPAFPTLTKATAVDSVDPSPVVTSNAPSSFSAGTTTVIWTARDASGNTATTSSQVGVFLSIDTSVDVPANCDATDTDGVVHHYQASSASSYLGICALSAALASSTVSSAQLSNQYPSLGLFVAGVGGVAADPNSQYWALYQNDAYASVGITLLPIAVGDVIKLQLHDFSDNNLGSQVALHIASLISTTTSATTTTPAAPVAVASNAIVAGGSSGVFFPTHHTLNLTTALQFLESKQKSDGSFGSNLYTDWADIGLTAANDSVGQSARVQNLIASNSDLSSATDYERHAMALMSLGVNPYSGTTVNYIQKIIDAFDGTQVGDPSLINDDIFSLFPLMRAGYSADDSMIQKIVRNIIAKQKPDGSWDETVDMTSAGIQALSMTPSLPQVSTAVASARKYLVSKQQSDGGFSSSFSTSWAMQAISALGETTTVWLSGGNSPDDSLYALQQSDGGVEPASTDVNTRIWATSYAIPASLHKPWASILQSFAKPSTSNNSVSGGGSAVTAVSATTTAINASSSVALASTTPVILQATSTTPTSTVQAIVVTPAVVSDDHLLRVPKGGHLESNPETAIKQSFPQSIIKKVVAQKQSIPPVAVSKPVRSLPPVASVSGLIPNTPAAHTATTFSLLGGILLVIALL